MPPSEVAPERAITIWGPVASGKTTFLAALAVALARAPGQWSLMGEDDASAQWLIQMTTLLTRRHAFPHATQGIEVVRLSLKGHVTHVTPRLWGLRRQQREEDVNIRLHLFDTQGEIGRPFSSTLEEHLIDILTSSHGMVLAFDPIREFEVGHGFDDTLRVLVQLAQRMKGAPGGKLPHHVALCVTKFDEFSIYGIAKQMGLLSYDPDPPGFPRVPDTDARNFFAEISKVISRSGDAGLLPSLLEKTFIPDRIKYFVTSAIGFYTDPTIKTFNPDDLQNTLLQEQAETRIRGFVNPINVAEAFLWLGRKVTEPASQQ